MDAISAWFTSVPLDWFILAIFATILTVDALRGSTARAAALTVALVGAGFLFDFSADTAFIGSFVSGTEIVQSGVFFALMVTLFVMIYRMMGYADNTTPLQALLAGVGATLVAVSVWMAIAPLQSIWQFSPSIELVFSESYRLLWIIAGLVLVTLSRA